LEPAPVPYFARIYPQYESFAKPIPRAAGSFDGKLYVLINGGCFSSTGHFCGLLKYHKIGIFIGTETGGTYECNDARQMFELRNTRFRLFVARMTFTAAIKDLPQFRGIIPDIATAPKELHTFLKQISSTLLRKTSSWSSVNNIRESICIPVEHDFTHQQNRVGAKKVMPHRSL